MSPRRPVTGRNNLVDRRPQNGTLDEVSKAIIEQLQADGRTSYATIAKSVVGICTNATPRKNVAATKPATSPITPPPIAKMMVLRSS